MAADFDHMRATHGKFVSFWLAATTVIGVAALVWFLYLSYRNWQRKRQRREERRQKFQKAKRRRPP